MEWFGWIWESNTWQRVTGSHAALSACSQVLSNLGKVRRVPDRPTR